MTSLVNFDHSGHLRFSQSFTGKDNVIEQLSLFDNNTTTFSDPLASRLRPRTLEEYIGQEHLLGKGKIFRQLIEKDMITSMKFFLCSL